MACTVLCDNPSLIFNERNVYVYCPSLVGAASAAIRQHIHPNRRSMQQRSIRYLFLIRYSRSYNRAKDRQYSEGNIQQIGRIVSLLGSSSLRKGSVCFISFERATPQEASPDACAGVTCCPGRHEATRGQAVPRACRGVGQRHKRHRAIRQVVWGGTLSRTGSIDRLNLLYQQVVSSGSTCWGKCFPYKRSMPLPDYL